MNGLLTKTDSLLDVLKSRVIIDNNSSTPLYLQLYNQLTLMIHEGLLQLDDALPSERALSEKLGVSRVTARKAIELLVADGKVERRRGSGNYIAHEPSDVPSRLGGFSEELRARGFEPDSRWIRRVLAMPSPEEMLALGLSGSQRIAKLERVRLADDTPMAHEISALPAELLADPKQVQSSLYETLVEKSPVRALQHIRAVNANNDQARLLDVPLGQALLHITRVGYDQDDRPIEFTHCFCRSDYYDFVAELRR